MKQFLSFATFGKKAKLILALFLFVALYINTSAQCTSATGWKQMSQGIDFGVALKTDGTIWMWGRNIDGVRGNGTNGGVIKHPEQVGTATDWKEIQTGSLFVLAIKNNGDLYGWGDNTFGQLGLSNNTDVHTPTLLMTGVKSFSAGYYHTTIVKNDGTLWSTGYNEWGNLGIGNNINQNSFKQESSNATNWDKTYSGWYNSFGIKSNGTLWSCGSHNYRVTGQGQTSGLINTFAQVGSGTNWSSLAVSWNHVLALTSTGKVWGWGHSNDGRLGIVSPGQAYYATPQAIDAANNYTAVSTGYNHSMVLRADGAAFAGGVNQYGKLGIGTTDVDTEGKAFQRMGTASNWASLTYRMGDYNTGIINSTTEMFSAGADEYYQLGNGDGTATVSTSLTQTVCKDDLAVNDVTKNKVISVYPNPAKDIINLNSEQKISEVKIYNVAGALIKTDTNVIGNKVNVSQLKPGVYIVKVNDTNDGIKFIKN